MTFKERIEQEIVELDKLSDSTGNMKKQAAISRKITELYDVLATIELEEIRQKIMSV